MLPTSFSRAISFLIIDPNLKDLLAIAINEQVQSIWWAPDDFYIVTAGMDGAIYEWDLKTCTRSREHVIKGSTQKCVIVLNGKSKLFLSATSDGKLREMDAVDVFQVASCNLIIFSPKKLATCTFMSCA